MNHAISYQHCVDHSYRRAWEITDAEVAERTEQVLTAWRDDESRFAETMAEVICDASPDVHAKLAKMAHDADAVSLGQALIVMFKAKWLADAGQRARDELEGNV